MIPRLPRARSGITLTEILFAILIMGIGMISLAVLFPIGLQRLQIAGRLSRSAFLGESAVDDLSTRNLLNSASFLSTTYSPWYGGINPWVYDTVNFPTGVYRTIGPGLPVAYDPLWRYQAGGGYYNFSPGTDARFGSGMGFINAESGDSGTPSAYGLQRLTNFNPLYYSTLGVPSPVPDIFVSPEDVVFEDSESVAENSVNVSPVVPDLGVAGTGLPTNDWRYTWFFTGQQTDASNTAVFNGNVVICENREFNYEQVVGPATGATVWHAAGETTVEGIFGYSPNPVIAGGASAGYAVAANSTVVLRWPSAMDDPDVRVGGWIADVTYERVATVDSSKMQTITTAVPPTSGSAVSLVPMQRCFWYQVAKKSPVNPDVLGNASYRSMTIWTVTPLQGQTLLSAGGTPVFANAALIMPSVVNVYSHTFYTR